MLWRPPAQNSKFSAFMKAELGGGNGPRKLVGDEYKSEREREEKQKKQHRA